MHCSPSQPELFRSLMYLITYRYYHRALHAIIGHLITVDDEVDAAEEEYRKLNSEGRF